MNNKLRELFYQFIVDNNVCEIEKKQMNEADPNEVYFQMDNYHLVFNSFDKDPYYFFILLPNFKINGIGDEDMREVINKMNNNLKVAKAILLNGSIWISIEQMAYSLQNINDLFGRLIGIMDTAISYCIETYNDIIKGKNEKKE